MIVKEPGNGQESIRRPTRRQYSAEEKIRIVIAGMRGLEILAQRMSHLIVKRRHDYLLKSLIYVQLADDKVAKLTGSTSNSSRSGGGTAYYCIPRSSTNILCSTIDEQIPSLMHDIQVNVNLIPVLRQAYTQELAEKLGHLRPSERASLTTALLSVDDEEARAARLFASGKITDKVWVGRMAESPSHLADQPAHARSKRRTSCHELGQCINYHWQSGCILWKTGARRPKRVIAPDG